MGLQHRTLGELMLVKRTGKREIGNLEDAVDSVNTCTEKIMVLEDVVVLFLRTIFLFIKK